MINLLNAEVNHQYTIKKINIEDNDAKTFLFRLGCYEGEYITIISKKKNSCIVVIKDGRYNLDKYLSESILVE